MIIATCDDNKDWSGYTTGMVEDYVDRQKWDAQILTFGNGRELMSYEGSHIDVLFLSIELNEGENGISLAKDINSRYPDCQIIFLTSHLSYAVDIFQVRHIYFALKCQLKDRLPDIFDRIMYEQKHRERKLVFNVSKGRQVQVGVPEIFYMERELRHTVIHVKWGEFQVKERMGELMDYLPALYFSRCHNSYIVYLPAVRMKKKTSYIMDDGQEVIISRSYREKTDEDWKHWVETQMIYRRQLGCLRLRKQLRGL
ncbi:MAG: LytTR family DNA-binding domain-containing protein [Clostridiales bacterium]|nr:LytTR family DNA-binding domain-containing protein [Clostridiales bacterium]